MKNKELFNKEKKIACVTGASGMVGSQIVQQLLWLRYKVRVLCRKNPFTNPSVELFIGGLDNEKVIDNFLCNAQILFHCAAEIRDKSKMWEVNVLGTKRLLEKASDYKIKYLCYLSSVGVIGKTRNKWVDEETKCDPQNTYERSKWAAEKVVARGLKGCRVLILRPTNVINDAQPGVMEVITKRTKKNRIKLFFIGGEYSHITHVENVAAAAIYFVDKPIGSPECFIVSSDHESETTYSGLYALFNQLSQENSTKKIQKPNHLPIFIPYLLRNALKGYGNMGDVRYSSEKIIQAGFKFPLSIEDTLRRILYGFRKEQCEY